MFFNNQYQLAYVTPDLDAGLAVLRDQYGVDNFKPLGGGEHYLENMVWTPEGEVSIGMKVAIATIGGLTLEVMEPVSGATGIYTEMLEPGQTLRLHHIAMRTDDIDAVRAEHERHGRRIVIWGDFKLVRFMYVDTRATLGHYMEYAQAPAEWWDR